MSFVATGEHRRSGYRTEEERHAGNPNIDFEKTACRRRPIAQIRGAEIADIERLAGEDAVERDTGRRKKPKRSAVPVEYVDAAGCESRHPEIPVGVDLESV